MLAYRFLFYTLFIILLALDAFGQNKAESWGIAITPGFSNGKLPSGISVDYPGPPFYVDLVVEESARFNIGCEVFFRKASRLASEFSIGLRTYGYQVNYSYDRELSTANNIYDQRKFTFLQAGYRLGKEFKSKFLAVEPYVGLSLNYAVRYRAIFLNIVNGEERLRDLNVLPTSDRLNGSYEIGISFKKRVNERYTYFLRPSFQQLVKSYEDNQDPPKKLYSFGLGLGILIN